MVESMDPPCIDSPIDPPVDPPTQRPVTKPAHVFAADEAKRWKRPAKRTVWIRRGRTGSLTPTVTLHVKRSRIQGKGLFLKTGELQAGDKIGRFWGRVVHESESAVECEAVGQRLQQDRLVLLHEGSVGGAGGYALVDLAGCVWEWSNCNPVESEPVLRVTESGFVETTRDVEAGEELTWDYDRASFRL